VFYLLGSRAVCFDSSKNINRVDDVLYYMIVLLGIGGAIVVLVRMLMTWISISVQSAIACFNYGTLCFQTTMNYLMICIYQCLEIWC